jgi:hypothetical protein
MGFKEEVQSLTKQFVDNKPYIIGEEAAKTALIIPFMAALGYKVFNPLEVKPEYRGIVRLHGTQLLRESKGDFA